MHTPYSSTAFMVLAFTTLFAHAHSAFAAERVPSLAGQASSRTPTAEARTNSGKAKLCATDDVKFDAYNGLSIPATSRFEDWGAISASKDDPHHWAIPERPTGEITHAAFVTLDGVTLSKAHRCAEARVKMLIAPLSSDTSQWAAANHLFALDDVLDYPIPTKRPPIEIGKLIDDMSIFAVLTADVNEASVVAPKATMDDAERAAKCLEGAQQLAAYVNAGVGTSTTSMAPLTGVPSSEASYGCAFSPKEAPDLFVAWDNQARPPAATTEFIAKAGEFLTGATVAELKAELAACVTEALEAAPHETGNREFRGLKIEC